MTPKQELLDTFDKLTPEKQTQLIAVAHQLQQSQLPPGAAGSDLISLLDELHFEPGEADTMIQTIQDNEEIDWDGWR